MTRPAEQAESLVLGLRRLGAEPLAFPTICIADPADPAPLRTAARELETYDWLVFTSANGVARFWHQLEAVRGTTALPAGIRVAAIGPATAAALKRRDVRPEVVPEEYVAEAVAEALTEFDELAGKRVLLPRAAGARKVLPERLRAAGAHVDEVIAYESRGDEAGISGLRGALEGGKVDMLTFTAASTVRHFVELAGVQLGGALVAVIGPVTGRAARSVGLRVDVEATEYTVDGLLQAICDYYISGRPT